MQIEKSASAVSTAVGSVVSDNIAVGLDGVVELARTALDRVELGNIDLGGVDLSVVTGTLEGAASTLGDAVVSVADLGGSVTTVAGGVTRRAGRYVLQRPWWILGIIGGVAFGVMLLSKYQKNGGPDAGRPDRKEST